MRGVGLGSIPGVSAKFREVDQLVDRVVWDHQAAGSSPVFPTKIKSKNVWI